MDNIVCPKCGKEIAATKRYCPFCGASISIAAQGTDEINLYNKAIALMKEGKYDDAIVILEQIPSYLDSKKLLSECRKNSDSAREKTYVSCQMSDEELESSNAFSLRKICQKLESISGYKDADEIIKKYKSVLNKKEGKKKKKVTIIGVISGTGVIAIVGALLLTFLYLLPNNKQNKVCSLIDEGDYDAALVMLEKQNNYGDTENLIEMVKAGQAFSESNYEAGIDFIYNIGGTVDVTYNTYGGTASKEHETIKRGRYINNFPAKDGYTFLEWKLTDYSIKSSKHYASITLDANYHLRTYKIAYELNGGINDENNPTTYTVEDSITLLQPTYEFRTFDGWFLNDELITVIAKGTTGDLTLSARWSQTEEQKAAEEEAWKIAHGIIPHIDLDNGIATYGLYPTTNINDQELLDVLNNLDSSSTNDRGWYTYNKDYYVKYQTYSIGGNYYFDNGTFIRSYTEYWFKCEPITWNILSNDNGEYHLLTSVLLDACGFGLYNSVVNYEYSRIRSWINSYNGKVYDYSSSGFYYYAFSLDDSYIQTTTVDNSAATTHSMDNKYTCNNTEDKVFIPSYQDLINSSYGFSTSTEPSETRCCKVTDYAKARGAFYNPDTGIGHYCTRSPSDYYESPWYVNTSGEITSSYYFVNNYGYGVRPAITLKIS